MIEILITVVLFATANAYITQYLLLTKKDSHFGFLPSKSKQIVFPEQAKQGFQVPEHRQPVTPVDHLRRLFGAYTIQNDEWVVSNYADVWTCQFCLSFWTSFIWSIAIWNLYQPGWLIIPIHFATAFATQRMIEFYTVAGLAE
jgi:hypothetical protein